MNLEDQYSALLAMQALHHAGIVICRVESDAPGRPLTVEVLCYQNGRVHIEALKSSVAHALRDFIDDTEEPKYSVRRLRETVFGDTRIEEYHFLVSSSVMVKAISYTDW